MDDFDGECTGAAGAAGWSREGLRGSVEMPLEVFEGCCSSKEGFSSSAWLPLAPPKASSKVIPWSLAAAAAGCDVPCDGWLGPTPKASSNEKPLAAGSGALALLSLAVAGLNIEPNSEVLVAGACEAPFVVGTGNGTEVLSSSAFAAEKSNVSSKPESSLNCGVEELGADDNLPIASSNAFTPEVSGTL